MTYDQLIYNALLLTMEPDSQPRYQGYVAIQEGKIAAVGQAEGYKNLPTATELWNAGGSLVMPGLINCHCHAAMTLFRGLADDLPLEQWLHQHIFPAEGRWVDFDFVYTGTRLAKSKSTQRASAGNICRCSHCSRGRSSARPRNRVMAAWQWQLISPGITRLPPAFHNSLAEADFC